MSEYRPSECRGCGTTFALRTDDSNCHKCDKLDTVKPGTAEYEAIENQPQCACCGLTRRHNMPVIGSMTTCGGSDCMNEARKMNGDIVSSQSARNGDNVPESHKERAAATAQRLKLVAPNAKPGTSLHTAALIYHEGGSGSQTEERIHVAIQTRLSDSKTPNTKIGNLIKYFGASSRMPDLMQTVLEVVSPQFVDNKLGSLPLQMSDVSLRWAGNRLPEPNSMTGTVANFFTAHSSSTDKVATYINNVPAIFRSLARTHNKKLLCLELVINMDAYTEREQLDAAIHGIDPDVRVGAVRKRTASSSSVAALQHKRLRSVLGSRFGPSGTRHATPLNATTQSRVSVQRFNVSVDPTTFEPEVIKIPGVVDAMIKDTHLAKGASKVVYDIVLFDRDGKEERAVGKRIYRTKDTDSSSLSNSVTLADNRAYLEAECVRLSLGAHLLDGFLAYAKGEDVAIFPHIKFATAYLATEMPVQVTRSPSVASGLEVFDPLLEAGMTWLIEPKRAAAVVHFTSTLDHSARASDLQSLTVHAFAHYAFGESESTLVFADLQGTPAPVRNSDGLILFDPMTHTTQGLDSPLFMSAVVLTALSSGSGLGDHGLDGIQTFIDTHECNQLCKKLKFPEVFPLELPFDETVPEPTEGSESGGAPDGTGSDDDGEQ
uniref:Alpha-type protein kinase domain-containing protein n=1 Tax=Mycena chlorophos TaxID=658473 RepID=A0ABQ0LAG1_MYCCL|nr:predicted protein [Mycena chlorophos]